LQKRLLLQRRGQPKRDSAHRLRVCRRVKGDNPPPPPPSGSPDPVGGPGGSWHLRFRDEFAGSELDHSKWQPNWFGSTDLGLTPQFGDTCADPRLVDVDNGALRIGIERRSCLGHPYAGGLVSTNPTAGGHFQFTHGYIEFRAKLPTHDGVWPALWTDGQNWPVDGEIDIMETGMPQAENPQWHYHYTGGAPGGGIDLPGSSRTWHTFAALWEPGRIAWYYDGDHVGQHTAGVANVPHYVIMNLGVWPGVNPPTPDDLEVDYVRVWQR
jgi:beta-glucanase (GH16 family)